MRTFRVSLQPVGAVVSLLVGIGERRRRMLLEANLLPPAPIPVDFLIDTGASCSWIDEMHMRSLGLEPRSWHEVHTVESKGVPKDFAAYEVNLAIGGPVTPNIRRFERLIGGHSFINQPFDGLLGRDVLNAFAMAWRGPSQEVIFEYV